MMAEARTVVIVEDEFLIAQDLARLCRQIGVEVLGTAAKAEAATALIEESRPTHVLMDVRLQGKRDGVEVAQAAHDHYPQMKIIFVTGSNEPPTMARIREDNPYRILIKPIRLDDLVEAFSCGGHPPPRRWLKAESVGPARAHSMPERFT